jgi:regulator of RNase E activity RraA
VNTLTEADVAIAVSEVEIRGGDHPVADCRG